jgi:hypothetical protein
VPAVQGRSIRWAKVGDNLPTQAELDALLATITGAVEELKKFCVTLQAEERKFTVKPLKGGEDMVQRAHGLAARYGVEVKSVPLPGMLNDLALARAIQRFEPVVTLAAQLVADTHLQARSEMWTAFLAYYGALSNAAGHDAALAAELKDLQDEMRHARRRRSPAGGGEGGAGSPG